MEKRSLDYKKIPAEFTGALDKVLYQLEMISRTVIALEQRVGISEDRMSEVLDFFQNMDSQGKVREPRLGASLAHVPDLGQPAFGASATGGAAFAAPTSNEIVPRKESEYVKVRHILEDEEGARKELFEAP